ncbi:cytochrome P450 4d2-like [Anthonomus grandis grandis]|uniref:cytochrome P450 4d2-like n=1 Tax=Anthonomus grandis grandis TaxID=2921223 RepID=UPI002165007B|nr:cytochrome P450 4d2-like [Anthonomus grandis grandis]
MIFALQILIAIVAVLLGILVYFYLLQSRARNKLQWMPQAPRIPLLGAVLEFGSLTETLQKFDQLIDNPQRLCYIELGLTWNILCSNYDLAEFILSSNNAAILDKSPDYTRFIEWLGTGLLTAPGKKWRGRRKIITPAFHFSILEQFVDVFEHNGKIMIEKLEKTVGKDSIDIYDYVTACALDIICETALGVSIHAQEGENSDYVFAVKELCRIPVDRSFTALKRYDSVFRFTPDYKVYKKHLKIAHSFTNNVIMKRKRELESTKGNGNLEKDSLGRKRKMAFLDLILNSTVDGKPLSNEDIREEVDTFTFEGHDTTASAITSAIFTLASYPQVQQKIREEQRQIYGNDKDRPTTYQDLQEMKYLEAVIKEVLRLYPSVPLIGRTVTADINFQGHTIPKDTVLMMYLWGHGRDPKYFEDPLDFKPERFLDNTTKPPYSYLPFSAGPRNCIGQKFAMLEMKSLLSKVFKNYEICPTDPPHQWKLSFEAVIKSRNGALIRTKKHEWN